MENNEYLLMIILGVGAIVGVAGTIAYYFARYFFKSGTSEDVPALVEEAAKAEVEGASQPSVIEVKRASAPGGAPSEAAVPPAEAERPKRLDAALAKTRASLWGRLSSIFGGGTIPADVRDQIEEILYTSDLGVATVERLMEAIGERLKGNERSDLESLRQALRVEMLQILKGAGDNGAQSALDALGVTSADVKPLVWLVVGVNGVGKTTTIGKLSFALAQTGRRVLVAAGDTFRAAAGSQLKVWTERAQVEIFAPENVSDPAAVAYQAVELAKSQKFDVVIVDTAGRLHTQSNLMEELKKVKRVLTKLDAAIPHQTLLVLDANSGQNAIVQAREFHKALDLTGVILTKMDGTAKGGVALSLAQELGLPPRLIGVGEKVEDLRPFAAHEYVDAII